MQLDAGPSRGECTPFTHTITGTFRLMGMSLECGRVPQIQYESPQRNWENMQTPQTKALRTEKNLWSNDFMLMFHSYKCVIKEAECQTIRLWRGLVVHSSSDMVKNGC